MRLKIKIDNDYYYQYIIVMFIILIFKITLINYEA